MKVTTTSILLSMGMAAATAVAQRAETTLRDWEFSPGHGIDAIEWQRVRIPHDWSISGPFDRANDLQTVAVWQNGETMETVKTGRTGGLPFIGKGTYRTTFEVPDTAGRQIELLFDGAMANARVIVNGHEAGRWANGYNSFVVDATGIAVPGTNEVAVELENRERASRWYPGAGLYRNVHLVNTDRVHIPVWGTQITTPVVNDTLAAVSVAMEIEGAAKGEKIDVRAEIIDPQGRVVATKEAVYTAHGQRYQINFTIDHPELWDLDSPKLYTCSVVLGADGRELDTYETRFGIRTIEFVPHRGFYLNGRPVKFRGVCNHHDLGPLGAAVNRSALRHQLDMLLDMGVNAIRTSHNVPAPELVELCDEMGIMMMVEPFDDWSFKPKSPGGYGAVFNEWAERDITNMVKHYRNNPSVVMWSTGNEVPSQWGPDGVAELTMLQDLMHSLDATRPVSNGMDQVGSVIDNGFAGTVDIPGFNYKPQFYEEFYRRLPQGMLLATESASTVSSRGVYYFPPTFGRDHNEVIHPENQSSGYDDETCSWSNTPDIDLYMDEQPWVLGQFVWTGFDYLGEPSPYDTDAWPSHSSLFGIIDLASLPKDRYYLYRSQWNENDTTLHVLPHWTWKDRRGKVTPVFVYTSLPSAELFVNSRSQGVRVKNDSTLQTRYRLMWNDVVYEPGELKVVAYDCEGNPVAEKIVRTAGKPHHLVLSPARTEVAADGDELVYVTVQVADRDGNICPTDSRRVKFAVSGAGSFEATANGDPTCVLPFVNPEMDLFSGAATVILRASDTPGVMTLRATAPGVKGATTDITVTK